MIRGKESSRIWVPNLAPKYPWVRIRVTRECTRAQPYERDRQTALIPRISLIPTSTSETSFRFKRLQFPVRLAFALSINKSQGQSVHHVGLYLRTPVFAHGQLYVALSRATSPHNIKILLPEDAEEALTTRPGHPIEKN